MTSRVLPTSLKKMGALQRQIQHKPLSHAILQMTFSNKRHSDHLASLLRNAKQGAVAKGMSPESLVVDQAWVTKGKFVKRMWVKGRGRLAIQRRPRVRIDIRVRDGSTTAKREEDKKRRAMKRLVKLPVMSRPLYRSKGFTC